MADELNLFNRGPEPPQPPEKDNHRVQRGIVLGCATNLALIVILPFLVYMGLGFFGRLIRPPRGNYFLPSLLGIVLITNGIIIFRAYRRDQRGIVIGFAIAGSLVLLLGSMCWSSGGF
jgi:hypothetical protein